MIGTIRAQAGPRWKSPIGTYQCRECSELYRGYELKHVVRDGEVDWVCPKDGVDVTEIARP